ncbi:MAG: hypothetical protein PHH93_10555 [Prolixibacteraceae bacterium]|nr:hypothetical protein [Prolixibacteraceae bacterium]
MNLPSVFINFKPLFLTFLIVSGSISAGFSQSKEQKITVKKELYAETPDKQTSEWRSQRYVNGAGLQRVEERRLQGSSDWTDQQYERYSEDNGCTWSEWRDIYSEGSEKKGNDEINIYHGSETYNPVYGHFVSVGMRRIFLDGHEKAYERFWGNAEAGFRDHSLLEIRKDGSDDRVTKLVKYEKGADYDPENWRDTAYINQTRHIWEPGLMYWTTEKLSFQLQQILKLAVAFWELMLMRFFLRAPK